MKSEEFFKIGIDRASSCTIQTDAMYVAHCVFAWISSSLLVVEISHHASGWKIPTGSGLYAVIFVVVYAIVTPIIATPQKIVITPESYTALHYWGVGLLSIKHTIPISDIEGVVVDLQTRKRSKRGQLILKWRVARMDFVFATYTSKQQALERGLFISERTGLPLLTIDMFGGIGPYNA